MNKKVSSKMTWDGRPLDQVKEGDHVPSVVFCVLVRTHNSQVNGWLNEGLIPYKDGRNVNRICKMIKVPSLAKAVTLLRDCGMSDSKLEELSAEGYATSAAVKKKTKKKGKSPKATKKKGNKPGPKPGSKRKLNSGDDSSPVRKYINQATKHELGVEKYTDIIEDAIAEGIVVAV